MNQTDNERIERFEDALQHISDRLDGVIAKLTARAEELDAVIQTLENISIALNTNMLDETIAKLREIVGDIGT